MIADSPYGVRWILRSLLNTLFPTECLACDQVLDATDTSLCKACFTMLEYVNPENRCSGCMALYQDSSRSDHLCPSCRHRGLNFNKMMVTCLDDPLSRKVITLMHEKRDEKLMELLASLMIIQLDRLKAPPYDRIAPIPHAKGGHQLTKILSKKLSIPRFKLSEPLKMGSNILLVAPHLSTFVEARRRAATLSGQLLHNVDIMSFTSAHLQN